MNYLSNKPFLATIALLLTNIIFIAVVWFLDINFLINTGFLALGALLAILTSFMVELHQRTQRAQDLARILHAELADLVSRCCFDSEAPWRPYWDANPPNQAFNVIRLRKFTPSEPVIFSSAAGELALLGGRSPSLLMQFHYRLNALRREINNIANDSTEATRVDPISMGAIKQVGLRLRQTLEQGLNALEALAPMVLNAIEIEAFAVKQYDVTRDGAPPAGTLRDRIKVLLY